MITNNNKIHINHNTEKASDGSIIRTSTLINIYAETVDEAVKLFNDIRAQIEANLGASSIKNETKVEPFPECPDHKVKMLMRTRRTDQTAFFACPFYTSSGCRKTAEHPTIRKINGGISSISH